MRQQSFSLGWRAFVARALPIIVALAAVWAPRPAAAASNLLGNAGFEQGAAGWRLCGAAELPAAGSPGVTPAMVYAGSRGLRLAYDTNDTCGSPVFDPYAAASQLVAIPADAEDVTISFWYSRVGNPVWDLTLSLAEPGGFGYLASVFTDNLPGWHQFRYELTLDQLNAVRGRTVELKLALEYSVSRGAPDAERPGFYLDDVRVVAGLERTPESPRPPQLAADGSAPIVYLDGQLGGIARMEADGSGRRLLYASTPASLSPAWSSAGDRVAVIQGGLVPEGAVGSTVNRARISKIFVVSAATGAAREVYRTGGLPGERPPAPTPGNPERPALDIEASFVSWSPDDQQIAVSVCSRNRSASGSTSDPICWVERVAVANGASQGKHEPGFAGRWSRANRLIYSNEDSYRADPQGIYEADVGAQQTRLLVPGMGSQFKAASFSDRLPAWAPDGQRFATVRNVSGFHYNEAGQYTVHYAIMLFTRGDPLGRQVVLVDRGSEPSALTWSPDGRFILYTLYQGQGADVWWLDTANGATGRLTTTGAAAAADWRWAGALPFNGAPRAYLPGVQR